MNKLVALIAACLLLPCLGASNAVNGQGTSDERPVFVKILPAIPDPRERQDRTAQDKEKAEKAEIDHGMLQYTGDVAQYTKYLFWATAALFGVTACLFGSATLQLRDSREAVAAAVNSAAIAERALQVAERTAVQQLRAYVSTAPDGPLSLDASGRITAALKTTNFGQTPAHRLVSSVHITLENFPPHHFQWDKMPTGSNSSLAPTESFAHRIAFPVQLDINQKKALAFEQAAIYVHAQITYLDVFDNEHATECTFYCTGGDVANGSLAVCAEGNTAT